MKVADGVLASSTLIKETAVQGTPADAADAYQYAIKQTKQAQIKYLINQANVRTSELKSTSVQEFVKTLRDIKADQKGFMLENIEVSAYASPDGDLDFNTKLAEKRQNTSSNYVSKQLKANELNTKVDEKYTAEDWDGFKELLQASNIQDKDVILRVLSMYGDPEEREKQIRNLSAGYKELADEILPELRRARLTINYNLIGRTDDEIKQQYKADAKELSVEELLYAATLTNDANESYGTISLQQAFAVSSNVVFGQVANEVGASSLVQFANAFGYGQKLGQDLTSAASIMADPSLMTEWETAWAGAGQPVGMDHTPGPQTTVMQNAVIAAAIANSGVVMDPYFVAQVLAPDGTVVKTTQSRSLGQAVSSATADQVKQAMLAVVQSGTGTDAQIPGVKVAGKTGSAETGGTNVNSMFVGFAPYDSPTVAISVALEDYDKHDVEAAKIAGIVLTAALAAQGA